MLYDYQYAVAALLANVILLITISQQIRFSTRSSRVFMRLIGCNTAATLADIITFFTISYPQSFPLWFVYLSNMIYMELNGLTAIYILRYAGAWTDDQVIQLKTKFWTTLFIILTALLVATTPLTGWIIRFDEELHYLHGPLMPLFYAISFSMTLAAVTLVIRSREKFQTSQMVIMIVLLACTILCFVLQMKFSRVDMNNLAVVLVLYYIYVILENPAFYMYRSTRCLNRAALQQSLNEHQAGLVLISVRGRLLGAGGHGGQSEISVTTAQRLARRFPKQTFALTDHRFAVITGTTGETWERGLMRGIEQLLSQPVRVRGQETDVEVRCRMIPLSAMRDSGSTPEAFVNALTRLPVEELLNAEDVSLLLARDRSRQLTS